MEIWNHFPAQVQALVAAGETGIIKQRFNYWGFYSYESLWEKELSHKIEHIFLSALKW